MGKQAGRQTKGRMQPIGTFESREAGRKADIEETGRAAGRQCGDWRERRWRWGLRVGGGAGMQGRARSPRKQEKANSSASCPSSVWTQT